MRLLHVDPFCGASGDMLLGAVLDLGVDVAAVREVLAGMDLPGWRLEAVAATRGGLGATQALVEAGDGGRAEGRAWSEVRDLLDAATLPEPVRRRAVATFERLAEAEGRVHRRAPEDVGFHEVGAVDAIVDIVGVCAGMHLLGVERVSCRPVALGSGTVRSQHGLLPVPAPAVVALLVGAPTYAAGIEAELCTPTGAALLAEWVDDWGDAPAMTIEAAGYGAGSRELAERPNLIRLVVGHRAADAGRPEAAVLLETTVDDLPGELVPGVLDALRDAGAADAWARPVLMKKGRPGMDLVCLVAPERAAACRRLLLTHTTTLGLRSQRVDKWVLDRDWVSVEVEGHPVRLKVGRLDGAIVNVAPEFDDAAAVAAATGLPVKEVLARARAAWPGAFGGPPPAQPA